MSAPLVVVIGAGAAGLAAARALRRDGARVVVLERAGTVGGRVRTVSIAGTPVDVGAQFVAPFYRRTLAVAHECGLGPRLRLHPQRAAVLHAGAQHPLDVHLVASGLLAPHQLVRALPLALTVVASLRRLRPDDLGRAAALDGGSAQVLVDRWAGVAVTERVVAPLLRSLLMWETATTSRALLLLLLAVAPRARRVHHLVGGLGLLPTAMARGLDVRLHHEVTGLDAAGDGWDVTFTDDHGPGARPGRLRADGVVCATTATVAAHVLASTAPEAAALLHEVTYSSTAVVTCAAPDARPSAPSLLLTEASSPWVASLTAPRPAAVPPAHRVVRLFLADAGARHWADADDHRLATEALAHAQAAGCPVRGAEVLHVQRWPEALPRFEVGSVRGRVTTLAGLLPPRLAVAGDHLGGPSVEGAVLTGERAAQQVLVALRGADRRV